MSLRLCSSSALNPKIWNLDLPFTHPILGKRQIDDQCNSCSFDAIGMYWVTIQISHVFLVIFPYVIELEQVFNKNPRSLIAPDDFPICFPTMLSADMVSQDLVQRPPSFVFIRTLCWILNSVILRILIGNLGRRNLDASIALHFWELCSMPRCGILVQCSRNSLLYHCWYPHCHLVDNSYRILPFLEVSRCNMMTSSWLEGPSSFVCFPIAVQCPAW